MIVAVLIAAFAAGATLGAAHFGSLWWSVVLLRDGRTGLGVAVQACASSRSRRRSPSSRARAPRRFSPPRSGVLAARALLHAAPSEARVKSPLTLEPLFQIGPVADHRAGRRLLGGHRAARRRSRRWRRAACSSCPSRTQATLELIVSTIDSQIRDTMQADPAPFRALIGSIFLFILVSNWSSLIPGVEPPTAHIETDAAMALIVFVATIAWGVRVARASAAISRPSPSRPG